MATILEALQRALEYQNAGNLPMAEEIYRRILAADSRQVDALNLLGVLFMSRGQHEKACQTIRGAVAVDAQRADLRYNLGVALHALGRSAEAEAAFREALRRQPGLAEADLGLGTVLFDRGELAAAEKCFREALRHKPEWFKAYNSLGNACKEQGRLDEAESHYRQALRVNPSAAEAHNNLGNVYKEQHRLAEALACYREALRHNPHVAEAHNNVGLIHNAYGKLSEALACFQEALRLKPDLAEAYNNMGLVLLDRDRSEEAQAHFEHALRLRPQYLAAHCNLGNLFQLQGMLAEAGACYQKALQHRPDYTDALLNLGNALMRQGRLAEAQAAFRDGLNQKPDSPRMRSSLLFCLNGDPGVDAQTLFGEHCRWGEIHEKPESAPPASTPDPERRLRVGYVSPDLRKHPVICFFEPILANHDRARVEAFCYAEVRGPDAVTARLRARAHGWRSTCGLRDAELAEQIRADGIDILVDLAGHTNDHRLGVFALKPAPVQITYLGYPNTTGLKCVDYRLTDAVADPAGEPVRHTEELVRLDGGLCCYAPPNHAGAVGPLPALQAGRVTFGSLNNLFKINGPVLDLWCAVLRAVPKSTMLLYRNVLRGEIAEHMRRQFLDRGIDADRLDLRSTTPGDRVLELYKEMDLMLDTFPWGGQTTACESLWMGVPVVTLYGKRHAGRWAASFLSRLGLTDLIARTAEEYVARAADWAGDLDRLARLRAELRARMMPTICDGQTFTRRFEETVRRLWQRWCKSRLARAVV